MSDTGSRTLDATAVDAFTAHLADLDTRVDDTMRIAQLTALEHLKRAAAAAQARVTAAFAASRVAAAAAAGVPRDKRGRGIGDQVALARGESPHRGGMHLGVATALVREMPHTLAALSAGRIDEWAATVLVRESAVLTADDRRLLDARMTGMLRTPGTGLGRLTRAPRGIAYDLDPTAATRRASKAAADRRVGLRPAPDTMTSLTALLPVTAGVAVYAALDRAAKTAAATGDGRGGGQVMADTLVQRATGHDPATPMPVAVQLVMTDTALLEGDTTPATIPGHGPVPAPWARALVAAAADTGAAFVRRLFTSPDRTTLVAMESKQRRFPASLAQQILLRDQTCATPWCDAPIRHIDHIRAHAQGGPTTAANGQGLCAHCNQAKTSPRLDHHRPRRAHHSHHTHRAHLPRHRATGPGLPDPHGTRRGHRGPPPPTPPRGSGLRLD